MDRVYDSYAGKVKYVEDMNSLKNSFEEAGYTLFTARLQYLSFFKEINEDILSIFVEIEDGVVNVMASSFSPARKKSEPIMATNHPLPLGNVIQKILDDISEIEADFVRKTELTSACSFSVV